MKSFIGAAFLTAPCAALYELAPGSTPVNDPEVIASLNAEEGGLWHAAPQKLFEGLTFDGAKVFLGAHPSHISNHLNETLPGGTYTVAQDDLPTDFDSRQQWKGLIHPIRDAEQCGSCAAFSAAEVLSDRVAIVTGKLSPVLSVEGCLSCDKKHHGDFPSTWEYLIGTGLVTETCWPCQAGNGCRTKCVDGEDFTRTQAKNSYAIKGAVDMQRDLVQNGPIQVAFLVYRSFMSYSRGIYHKMKKERNPEGAHAVKIVGYGAEGKNQYWTAANSWGADWGEDGFFRILRGNDECGIETLGPPYAGLPAVSAPQAEKFI